jgi:hypothetical protein
MTTINCTPTWENCVPMLIHLMESGTTKESAQFAKEEILRMAKLADKYVETQKTNAPDIEEDEEPYEYGNLDLRKPQAAAAYLKAASHYLSYWPQEWSAERLCLALLSEESDGSAFEDRQLVKPWEAIVNKVTLFEDPFLYVEELIIGLADDFIQFAQRKFDE